MAPVAAPLVVMVYWVLINSNDIKSNFKFFQLSNRYLVGQSKARLDNLIYV